MMNNTKYNTITRHEAAEALCHSKDKELLNTLNHLSINEMEPIELRETCQLSLNYIQNCEHGDYVESDTNHTRDPAVMQKFGAEFYQMDSKGKITHIVAKMDNLIQQYQNTNDQLEKYHILNQKYEILMHFKN